jgi:hypothetical protein
MFFVYRFFFPALDAYCCCSDASSAVKGADAALVKTSIIGQDTKSPLSVPLRLRVYCPCIHVLQVTTMQAVRQRRADANRVDVASGSHRRPAHGALMPAYESLLALPSC